MNHYRRLFIAATLLLLSARSFAQIPSPADEKAQEALVASAWSGEIAGFPVQFYLLDENLLVLKAGEQKPRFDQWRIVGGRFVSPVKLSEQTMLLLRADIRGSTMTGTALEGQEKKSSDFALRKLAKPPAELLAAAPPGRPHAPPALADPKDFEGRYEMTIPEHAGRNGSLAKASLTCKSGMCEITLGKAANAYDKIESVHATHFNQARFALRYARERKDKARELAPYLAPLLDSDAVIQSCLSLASTQRPGADTPGITLLCKLDRSPWGKPAVLLMGTILSNCGPAFCRYAILPLVRP